MKPMYLYLKKNPQLGFLSGVTSRCLLSIQELFTNDHILKIVSGVGVWAGALVAVVTLMVWLIRMYGVIRIQLRK